jgi:hypothetical protein
MLAGGGIRGAPAGESLRLLFGLTKARSSVRKYGPGTVLSLTERPKINLDPLDSGGPR